MHVGNYDNDNDNNMNYYCDNDNDVVYVVIMQSEHSKIINSSSHLFGKVADR
jgi:hypothetical protein